MKFKLLHGGHEEGGKNFNEGDVVESNEPLDEIFRNKFRKIMAEESEVEEVTPIPPKGGKKNKKGKESDSSGTNPPPPPPPPPQDDQPKITLKAIRRKKNCWDVVKIIDGVQTDQCVNTQFLTKKQALALEAKGV